MPITPLQSINRNPSSGSAPTKTNTTPTIKRRNTEILPSDLHFLNEYLEEEYSNEDEHETSEYFISVTIDEIVCALFAILSIGSGIIYYETRICESECDEFFDDKKLAEKVTLIFSSLSALFFIVSLIPKYYHVFKLMKIARYISIKDSFRESNLWIELLVELILAIIHPNLIFKDKYVTTGKGWNILNVDYNWNDFFLVIMIFRLFYVVKIVIISTKYFTARADRVCKMMGMKLDLFRCKQSVWCLHGQRKRLFHWLHLGILPFFLLSILPYDKYCAVVFVDGNRKQSVCRRFRLVP